MNIENTQIFKISNYVLNSVRQQYASSMSHIQKNFHDWCFDQYGFDILYIPGTYKRLSVKDSKKFTLFLLQYQATSIYRT